jgi:RNA polymerase sigma factor (sigma-70 family)
MRAVSTERALWIARHIVPHEFALRAQLARWRLPHDLDADDVIQECYAKFATMDSVDEIRNPRNYLYSVARTHLLMHVRHARVVSIRAVDDVDAFALPANEPSPEEQVSDREQLHLLALAVAELPDTGRKAFLLRMMDELSHKEIGARLGMSDNAVQKSIAKSLSFLMAKIGRGGNTPSRASSSHHDRKETDRRG